VYHAERRKVNFTAAAIDVERVSELPFSPPPPPPPVPHPSRNRMLSFISPPLFASIEEFSKKTLALHFEKKKKEGRKRNLTSQPFGVEQNFKTCWIFTCEEYLFQI